jgi:hypothetical protein
MCDGKNDMAWEDEVEQMLARPEKNIVGFWKARTMVGDVRVLRVQRVDEDRSEVRKLWGRWVTMQSR